MIRFLRDFCFPKRRYYFVKNVTPGSANQAANEGALANFFNSLLTRKSGGAVTPTSTGTPVTQRQSKLFIDCQINLEKKRRATEREEKTKINKSNKIL